MWTSSYLPGRRTLLPLGLLIAALLGLLGLGLHLRRCAIHAGHGGRAGPAARAEEGIPVRLYLGGTPGACVRLDGHVVGPIPAAVELRVRGPRRVRLQACKSGHLDFATELDLRPGQDATEELWLPRYRLLQRGLGAGAMMPRYAPRPSLRCPCQG